MRKIMIAMAAVSALALMMPVAAHAQTSPDPYATGQADYVVKQLMDEATNTLENVMFAAYCKVIPDMDSVNRLTDKLIIDISEQGYWQESLRQPIIKAMEDAGARGKAQAGNDCSYWHEHPEAVQAMRLWLKLSFM
jgi:hypothetical protein